MDISIVIPVWNEAGKIARDIIKLDEYLDASRLRGKIIVSDDGSTDGTSDIAASQKISPNNSLRVLRTEAHHGKGYAVRQGILASTAPVVMFMDSGGNVPLTYIQEGINLLKSGVCDIAIGSRHLAESDIVKKQIWYRRLYSRAFRVIVKKLFQIPGTFNDTQCGFKLYIGDVARSIYRESELDGFIFDLEVILIALRHGYRIREFPIRWTCDRDSRLSSTGTIIPVARQIMLLRRRFKNHG